MRVVLLSPLGFTSIYTSSSLIWWTNMRRAFISLIISYVITQFRRAKVVKFKVWTKAWHIFCKEAQKKKKKTRDANCYNLILIPFVFILIFKRRLNLELNDRWLILINRVIFELVKKIEIIMCFCFYLFWYIIFKNDMIILNTFVFILKF
jgi:hypothetical protein